MKKTIEAQLVSAPPPKSHSALGGLLLFLLVLIIICSIYYLPTSYEEIFKDHHIFQVKNTGRNSIYCFEAAYILARPIEDELEKPINPTDAEQQLIVGDRGTVIKYALNENWKLAKAATLGDDGILAIFYYNSPLEPGSTSSPLFESIHAVIYKGASGTFYDIQPYCLPSVFSAIWNPNQVAEGIINSALSKLADTPLNREIPILSLSWRFSTCPTHVYPTLTPPES